MTDRSIQKYCPTCKVNKPLSDFHKNKTNYLGVASQCKICKSIYARSERRKEVKRRFAATSQGKAQVRKWKQNQDWKSYRLKVRCKKFGITVDQYEQIKREQDNKCAICSIDFNQKRFAPAIDHCHKTGKVRGLLCLNCNSGIGKLREDVQILKRAIAYIELHS